jgi:hypothetical protein
VVQESREVERLKALIVSLEEVHLRADVLEKRLDVVSEGFAELSYRDREAEERSIENELAQLAARRIHLLTLCGVKDRVTAGEAV